VRYSSIFWALPGAHAPGKENFEDVFIFSVRQRHVFNDRCRRVLWIRNFESVTNVGRDVGSHESSGIVSDTFFIFNMYLYSGALGLLF